jgi:hypothetical protein
VLLDENVPYGLARLISGHEAQTVALQGWAALTNGALIDAAEAAGFDALVTADRNMQYQQNISQRRLAVVVLPTNRLVTLATIVPEIIEAINVSKPGTFIVINPCRNAP